MSIIKRLIVDHQYKEAVLDSLCLGVVKSSSLRDVLEYVIVNKLHLFNNDKFKSLSYDDEDDIQELILPVIKRAWGKVFVDTPQLFNSSLPDDNRLELYQLSFDIDEFIDYLIDIFDKAKNCLNIFENLDKTKETLSLIVDNYIAGLVLSVLKSDDIKIDIRDFKIKKITNG